MRYRKIYLHTVIFLLTILIVVGMFLIMYKVQNTSPKPVLTKEETSLKTTPLSLELDLPVREKVKPSRPEDLGITVYSEYNEPETQEEWNVFIKKSYRENRREFEKTYAGEFGAGPYEQLDNADLREIEKNRARLDEKISECEGKLESTPDDEDLKTELKNWQKLKALLIAVYGEKSDIE